MFDITFLNLDLTWSKYVLIVALTFIAKFYGSIVGGGSFLLQPALTAIGLPVHVAIAQDVSCSIGNNLGGVQALKKKEPVERRFLFWLLPGFLIGPYIGAQILYQLSENSVEKILACAAISMVFYLFFLKKDQGLKMREPPQLWGLYTLVIGFILGSYTGISGAGSSTILSLFVVNFLGVTFLQSLALKCILNLLSAMVAFISFLYAGLIDYKLLFLMMVTSVFAGYFANKMALKIGNKWLKASFSVFVLGLAFYLLLKQ